MAITTKDKELIVEARDILSDIHAKLHRLQALNVEVYGTGNIAAELNGGTSPNGVANTTWQWDLTDNQVKDMLYVLLSGIRGVLEGSPEQIALGVDRIIP